MHRFYQAPYNEYWHVDPTIGSYIPAGHPPQTPDQEEPSQPSTLPEWMGLLLIATMLVVSGIAFTVVTTKIAEAWTIESHKVSAPLNSPVHWDF